MKKKVTKAAANPSAQKAAKSPTAATEAKKRPKATTKPKASGWVRRNPRLPLRRADNAGN